MYPERGVVVGDLTWEVRRGAGGAVEALKPVARPLGQRGPTVEPERVS
jgi:hypothetical protein